MYNCDQLETENYPLLAHNYIEIVVKSYIQFDGNLRVKYPNLMSLSNKGVLTQLELIIFLPISLYSVNLDRKYVRDVLTPVTH